MANYQVGKVEDSVSTEDAQQAQTPEAEVDAGTATAEAPQDAEATQTEDILPDLDTEDWMSKLAEDEVFNSKEGPCPRLHGLRRLAKPYVRSEESRVNHLVVVPRQVVKALHTYNGSGDVMSTQEELGVHNFPMASVTFLITDIYGRTFSDSADAYYSNCNELGHFPTAVASARAEARALRKLLGIKQHAAEEMVDKDASEELAPDDDGPAKPAQIKLIDKIVSGLDDFSLKDLFGNITAREIYSVEELTVSEARKALQMLNDQKKKQKQAAAKAAKAKAKKS
jgi:hypothetical protein